MKHRHRIVSGPDQVTGKYRTACGLEGLPLGMNEFDSEGGKRWTAGHGIDPQCSRCKLKLSPPQRKILRLLFQFGSRARIVAGRRFWWTTERGLVIAAQRTSIDSLVRWRAIYERHPAHNYELSPAGRALAETLEPITEEPWKL